VRLVTASTAELRARPVRAHLVADGRVLGAKELAGGEPVLWDVVPQMQVSLSKRQHIMINVGGRVPVNARESRRTQVLTYFLWDWFDGGLVDGRR
jgi:hypothetical protein